MSQIKYTILESWPQLKEDLENFLSDTDAWAILQLKEAHEAKDWMKVGNLIEMMELLHDISHAH